MLRGLYIAATGMLTQRRKMETITNNITNVETAGYKKDTLVSHSFDDVLLNRINDNAVVGQTRYTRRNAAVGPLTYGSQVDQLFTDFSGGSLEQTELNTDLAIVGDAFFVMETPAGERYTKTGTFLVNAGGYLVDGDGHFLMGDNGRVWVGGDSFAVNEGGQVFVNGQQVNTLRLVSFADNGALRKQGGNLYAGANPQPAVGAAVKQGFIEGSNVDVAREMVDMMTVYRAYETNQRILTMIDETAGKAVNEIARF